MAIPANLSAQITALNAAFQAASPLSQAPRASITALQINADNLVSAVDVALAGAAGALDTFTAPLMPDVIAANLQTLLTSAQSQTILSDLRGLAGRVASNLNQA